MPSLDRLAEHGFRLGLVPERLADRSGGASESRARNPEWRQRVRRKRCRTCSDEDIAGSGFAITGYTVHRDLGGDAALARLRQRLRQRGLKLMLDFVPNHMALGSSRGSTSIPTTSSTAPRPTWLARRRTTAACKRKNGPLLLAYGRDPYFAGWPDTLQLNYGNPATAGGDDRRAGEDRRAMRRRALRHGHAGPARRVRTHLGHRAPTLLAEGDRARAASRHPDFCFMAEVYWDLEWTLQQQGFDYAYDKRLYDRLREGHARPVREHFHAGLDYQDKLARFLENHDEPRAAATFPPGRARSRGGHHVPVARAALLPPGTIRGAQETHLAPSGSRSGGTDRPEAGAVLRPAAGRAASAGRARRRLAIARMHAGLGRQLDLGLLRRLRLARR